ncbi:TetR/AcrR family transcriptional regulator [Photobacterium damselae]|uniref:TetR/AcrR family transcriptional regulator n=3 Tax=Photobacterium damselae TaxID=38293 RepID=A0A1V1VD93_PHODP|nr:TetR/AcrR family transcriptional regulator [Photobacterium damselae]EJN6961076.1 TetR/AcrR family transcriptional regulator [Photobacterium damselae]KAB1511599.1 TetR/AcrR family transcriptional regulator [Photobacterium damselae subsp. damselae]MBA5683551.1 TetR/AcrR family transcriptional regulator [Photobacterium damselae subsp. damselae]MBE8127418.1 TetR/AcrR family transcriptional regulator [Photobacterium damselae subsp. piscicida]MCG3825135.1 TetR/AcrR family transcriptional regulato
MPKRSKEDTEITIQTIMDAVVDQILTLGYDKMSYTTLSNQTGISRTGISHHFPKKQDFANALDGRIFQIFVEKLDLEHGLENFSLSWNRALDDEKFRAVLRLLFLHISATETSHEFASKGIERLFTICVEKFGVESSEELERLLGRSLVRLAK